MLKFVKFSYSVILRLSKTVYIYILYIYSVYSIYSIYVLYIYTADFWREKSPFQGVVGMGMGDRERGSS